MATRRKKEKELTFEDYTEIVTTPDGREFSLPDQLDEYREENPVGAAEYENRLRQLYINSNNDPELDPDSQQFNKEKYYAEFEKVSGKLQEVLKAYTVAIPDAVNNAIEALIKVGNEITTPANEAQQILLKTAYFLALNSDSYAKQLNEYLMLLPYLKEELKKKKYYGGCTLEEFFKHECKTDEEETEKDELWEQARAAAIAAKEKAEYIPTARELALNQGAVMSLNGSIASFSDTDLRDAFTSFSITELYGDIASFDFEEETGKLNTQLTKQNARQIDKIQESILMAILKAVIISTGDAEQIDSSQSNLTIYLPQFCRELNIDPRAYSTEREAADPQQFDEKQFEYIKNMLLPFEKYVGRLPNGSIYRVLTIGKYETDSRCLTINTPFMFKALEIANNNKLRDPKHKPNINKLLHSSVHSERNFAAVELANRIAVGILARGYTNPKTKKVEDIDPDTGKCRIDPVTKEKLTKDYKYIEYTPYFATIIRECPQLTARLEAAEGRQAKNSLLKSTFKGAYRILKEKSDIYSTFEGLYIADVYPSQSTLKAKMLVTYPYSGRKHCTESQK